MSTLYTLVVVTIMSTSTQAGVMYDQLTEKTPNLSQAQCSQMRAEVYNKAVEAKRNVVIKCVPQ